MDEMNIPQPSEEKRYLPIDQTGYVPIGPSSYFAPMPPDPELVAKKELKKSANKALLSLLFFYGFSVIFKVVITIIAVIYASKGAEAYARFTDFVGAATFNLLFNSFYQCIFMTLPFVFAALISRVHPSDILCYKKPDKASLLPLTLFGFGGAMLCNLANSIVYSLFSLFGSSPQGGNIEMDMGIESLFLNILTVAVIPALFEEFAFRGILMGLLRKKFSTPAAIIISATAFGLIHGNFSQMPFAFLMGILLGYLYAASGSLWVPMLVHFVNNSYSVLLDHITHSLSSLYANIIFYFTLIFFLLAGVVAFVFVVKKKPEWFKMDNGKSEMPTSRMLKIAFSSPVFIISAALFIIDAIVIQLGGVA